MAEPRLLLDTSAAIALVMPDNPLHVPAREATRGHRLGLAGHALVETYSVLTRLPPPHRIRATHADRLIRHDFPDSVALPESEFTSITTQLARWGLRGGAAYDGIIAATSVHHRLPLLSADARASSTYEKLGATVRYLGQES